MRICPKCKYVRQSADTAPDWQCPACHVAYAKAADAAAGREYVPEMQERKAPVSSLRNVTWLLLAVLVVAFLLYGKLRKAPPRLSVDAPIAAQGSTRQSRGAQPSVVLYATSWCGYCKATREFFADYGIRYTEYDIEESSSAHADYRKLGGQGVPLIVVGEQVLKGYNPQALTAELEPWMRR